MRTQINLKLDSEDLEAIDAAVQSKNRKDRPGSPRWTRTSFMLAASLNAAETEDVLTRDGPNAPG